MDEIEKFIIERMDDKPTLSELYGGEVTFGFAFVIQLMEEYHLSKLHQPTVISSLCKHEWYETENFYIKCKKCNQLKNFMQTDL